MTNGDAQERVTVMEVSHVELREQIIRVEGRMDVLETKMEGIEKRMDRLEAKVDRLLFALLGAAVVILGSMAAGFIAVLAALAN